ncbi:MAG: diaminopimelate epimerase [Actinomycetota bacterium]
MTRRSLTQWHGAGNYFYVDVTTREGSENWTPSGARDLCHQGGSVVVDGLLVAIDEKDSLSMVLYNADGSRAEISGNGIRCLVAAVLRARGVNSGTLDVSTDAGVRRVSVDLDGSGGRGSADMGDVILEKNLPGAWGVVSVGNPHVVVMDRPEWADDEREALAASWSTQMGGANVEFVTIENRSRMSLRVIERGVGWTQACGTGTVASVAVARQHGVVDDVVVVRNPGGELLVELDGMRARLDGPIVFVGEVEWQAS